VTCSVCHQIEKEGLGTDATFVGNVKIAQPDRNGERPEYGPFDVDKGHRTVMHSSTATYLPTHGGQVRDSGLCGSCHTLITSALQRREVISVWQLPQSPESRTCPPCVGRYVAVEECITVRCPLSTSNGPYSGRSPFRSGCAIFTLPTNVASVPSPSFSIWWHTEHVTPSAAALSPLGNVASGNRENTSVCLPASRSASRTAGIWQIEHSSSIACFDSG